MAGIFNSSIFNNAIFNTDGVAPPPTPTTTQPFSGGYFDYGMRRPHERDVREAMEGIAAPAAEAIAAVAASQAERLEQDEHKRFEELERELLLRGIEWEARYLAALNAMRERLIGQEIAARLAARQDEEAIVALLVMAVAAGA